MASLPSLRSDFNHETSVNVGAIADASQGYVINNEFGDGILHQTLLTFQALPVTTGNTTGASFGSKQIYTFPVGRILVLGNVTNFTLVTFNTAAGVDGDIGGGGSGDYAMGSTATADATLTGTDVDMLPSSALLDPFVSGVGRGNAVAMLAAAAQFDGTGGAKSVYLNAIIDDADVSDAAASDPVYFTGSTWLTWIWLGLA